VAIIWLSWTQRLSTTTARMAARMSAGICARLDSSNWRMSRPTRAVSRPQASKTIRSTL
jgi:hypothetical protein